LLFTGELIEYGSIGELGDPRRWLESINIFNSFPGSTIFFPRFNRIQSHIKWISLLDPENSLVQGISKQIETKQKMLSNLTDIEKGYNPYLRVKTKYYQDLLEENNIENMLLKLKEFERIQLDKL